MNSDVVFEILLILLCMYFAFGRNKEKLMHEHYKSMYKDKVDLLQTYKHLLDRRAKQTTRIQNELNRVGNLYMKMQRDIEKQSKKNT